MKLNKLKGKIVVQVFLSILLMFNLQPSNGQAPVAPQKEVTTGSKSLIDYFLPTPVKGRLTTAAWGAAEVGPRDQSNGLEDRDLAKYVYWDGGIIKGTDGLYHMFASRWDQAAGHNGWMGQSYAIHATSKDLYGPYTDKGLCWPAVNGGKGHNVTPLQLKDGRYAITVSGTRQGGVFVANSLNGPWSYLGDVRVEPNPYRFSTGNNLQIILRPDGKYEAINSSGLVAIADSVDGPYKVQGPSFYKIIEGTADASKLEDPVIWYSGGKYHWITNEWNIRKAFHFTSADGLSNWKLEPGFAYDPTVSFIRYTNGTVNHWRKLERPKVYIEHGHVKAFTFAAINVEKEQDIANDKNGSKVIVVPFDGAAFDRDANKK